MKYIIGSGWWATNDQETEKRPLHGTDIIRSTQFHKLWYQSICEFTFPQKIIIVDSSSPLKPPINKSDDRIEFISLDKNYGHSSDCIGKFSGWMRSCLLGVSYAWSCDADYFVYVEQDVLLFGKGIIEHAISKMKHKYMFGDSNTTYWQPLQQSLFLIHKSEFIPFIKRMDEFHKADSKMSPEIKFATIKFNILPWVDKNNKSISAKISRRIAVHFYSQIGRFWFDKLPFGFGRDRPIRWGEPFFYFQHATLDEINRYIEHTNFVFQ